MTGPFLFLILLFLNQSALARSDSKALFLAAGTNQTVKVPGVVRIAVGSAKIIRIRAIPPATILVTGMVPGATTMHTWSSDGTERSFDVTVVAAELFDHLSGHVSDDVVKVSLEFLELDFALGKTLGIEWPNAIQFTGGGVWQGSARTSGLNYVVTFDSTQGFIHTLIQEGWGRVLASPDLYVRLGEQAMFHSGGEIPILTASDSFGQNYQHVEWKPFGLTVKVRPESGDLVHFRSDVKVEISELDSNHSVGGIPAMTDRNLETKINARDGETVILSGLVRQSSAAQRKSLPFFSAIPLLGPLLFSSTAQSRDESEVLMAVTYSLATRSREGQELEQRRKRLGGPIRGFGRGD